MIIGVARISLRLPGCHSLKEKRRHLNTIKARLSAAFNVSVAEVDDQDKWQKAVLAVAHVGLSRPVVDSLLAHVVDKVEAYHDAQMLDYETELIA